MAGSQDFTQEFKLSKNEMFGKYQIMKKLGEGGMGVVYGAIDTQINRPVALKVLSDKVSGKSSSRARFLREAEAMAKLTHSHIVKIYEYGSEPACFIAMEYIKGKSLGDYLDERKGNRMTVMQAVKTMHNIAKILSHAHKNGIIHRDLKPDNVMIKEDNQPVIMDFGLARIVGEKERKKQTVSGDVLGTPSYMSPEQVLGKSKDADARSDIFSLGAMFYEMITGVLPFQGNTPMATMFAVSKCNFTPPSKLQPSISTAVDAVCRKCMQKNPDDRYQNATEFAKDLKALLDGEQPKAKRKLPAADFVREAWSTQKPLLIGLGACFLMITSLLFLVFSWKAEAEHNFKIVLKQKEALEKEKLKVEALLGRAELNVKISTRLAEMAQLIIRGRDYPALKKRLWETVKLDPTNSASLSLLSLAALRQQNLATKDVRELIQLLDKVEKKDWHVQNMLFQLYTRIGEHQKARKATELARKAAEGTSEGVYFKGVTHFEQGFYQNALKCFEQALEIPERRYWALNYKYRCLVKQREYQKAIQVCRLMQKENPSDVNAHILEGHIYEANLNNQTLAGQAYMRAATLGLDYQRFTCFERAGKFLAAADNFPKAMAYMAMAAELAPGLEEVRHKKDELDSEVIRYQMNFLVEKAAEAKQGGNYKAAMYYSGVAVAFAKGIGSSTKNSIHRFFVESRLFYYSQLANDLKGDREYEKAFSAELLAHSDAVLLKNPVMIQELEKSLNWYRRVLKIRKRR